MNKKQYNNIIENTLKNEQKSDSLETARAIFNNMGVALPNGNMREVYEVIKGNDYMGWKSCTMEEAQLAADNGVAAIGISENRIVVLSATDDEEPVAQNETVMTLSSDLTDGEVSDLSYYTYSYRSTAWGDGSGTTTHRKAIIIVPGAMGTELELAEDAEDLEAGTQVWPPFSKGEPISSEIISKLWKLQCNTDGESFYNLRVSDNHYGVNNMYKKLYTDLQDAYGSNYDVIFYGYDWRKSSAILGIFFANLIDEYESVIIVAHSMGGLVTSHLLRNTYIRSKVEKVITLGTPFLGSLEMLPLMFDGQLDILENALANIAEKIEADIKEDVRGIFGELLGDILAEWFSGLVEDVLEIPMSAILKELSANIPSLYELLPTKQFFSLGTRNYYYERNFLGNTLLCETFEATRNALDSYSGINFNTAIFDQATNRHDALWEDETTHVTSHVNTYYIVGESKATAREFYESRPTSPSLVNSGDGTVLSYSASMNNLYPGKTYFVDEEHSKLQKNGQVIKFIKAIIDGSTLYVEDIKTTSEYGL